MSEYTANRLLAGNDTYAKPLADDPLELTQNLTVQVRRMRQAEARRIHIEGQIADIWQAPLAEHQRADHRGTVGYMYCTCGQLWPCALRKSVT